MWAQTIQVMFGCWLAMSPFIFGHRSDQAALWINDFASATAVIVLSLLSFWTPTRRAYLGNLAVGAWLVGYGWAASGVPAPPALQNHIVIGLLLLIFGIIPPDCNEPPRSWRDYREARSREQ